MKNLSTLLFFTAIAIIIVLTMVHLTNYAVDNICNHATNNQTCKQQTN